MCRQTGIILGKRQRTAAEMHYFMKLFSYLLLLGEQGGPHATGSAWLKQDGTHSILKHPQKASTFVCGRAFRNFLTSLDSGVTWLAGHNRWQTVGDASNNRNNHPIRAGQVIGTAQGTITNADYLFAHFGLPRSAEVDSELIFRLAEATLTDDRINTATLKARIALCKGELSAVMASRFDPETVVVIKGKRPLEFRYNKTHRVVIYASDASHLNMALSYENGWRRLDIRPMTIATISCSNITVVKQEPFRLAAHRRWIQMKHPQR